MPITKAQRDYAMKRIGDIFRDKERENKDKHFTPPVQLKTEEAWDLVQKGKVKLAKGACHYKGWRNIFDFSKYEHSGKWSKVGETKSETLKKDKQEAEDCLMLGDAEEALAIIKQYS